MADELIDDAPLTDPNVVAMSAVTQGQTFIYNGKHYLRVQAGDPTGAIAVALDSPWWAATSTDIPPSTQVRRVLRRLTTPA